jgi:hypothetical protein
MLGLEKSDSTSMARKKSLISREECLMIRIKYEPNLQKIIEVEVTPRKEDSLITFVRKFMKGERRRTKRKEPRSNNPAPKNMDPSPTPPTTIKKNKKV